MRALTNIRNKVDYKWYILALVALTGTLVFAMPMMSLPVLFEEISEELNLDLVQLGTIWGIIPLAGIFVVLIGGLLCDRFGSKRVLVVGSLLTGLAGILRGLSDGFITLAATMFLFGLVMTITLPGLIKACSIWFSGRHLGLANGVHAMSMGLGFMMGAMVSATILSPLLGGWWNVTFLYGAVAITVSVLWLLSRSKPAHSESPADSAKRVPFWQSLSRVFRIKRVWLLAFIMIGQISCVQGMFGYLPLYLREIGWTAATADWALSAFHGASTIATIPITLLSDRLNSRKVVLFTATLATAIGVGLVPVFSGIGVWTSVIIAGVVRDGFMAVHLTMIIETDGVGPAYTGTAVGLVFIVAGIGEFIAPPIGNSLAAFNPSLPFVFWSALATVALLGFIPLKERAKRKSYPYD